MLVRKVRSSCSALISLMLWGGVLLGGVVDQHVQAAELAHGPVDRVLAEGLVAHVAGEGQAAAALGLD